MTLEWEQGPLLGSGGMADVYLAIVKDPKGPRLLALKRLRGGNVQRELAAQLEREAKIGSLLNHPNVVRVEASGQDAQGPWLAMEYVAGRSARRILRAHLELSRFLEPRVAATILCDAAKGLAHVHALHVPEEGLRDVVHRDISSDNILVDLDGRSKLADFGVARIAGLAGLTRAGSFKGKIAYAAPELIDGAAPTHKSDYFAFAATVFELLEGRYAFLGRNEVETLDNVLNRPAPPLTRAPPDVAEWVAAALEKNPKQRPDSLTALVLALGRLAAPHAEVAAAMREVGAHEGVQRADSLTTQLTKARPSLPLRWLLPFAALLAVAVVSVLLMKKPAAAIAPLPVVQRAPEPPRAVAVAPPAPEPITGQPAAAEPPRPKRPAGKTALVKFRVRPWGNIWLDGKKLGIAPFETRVPVGRHTFEVRNPELGAAELHELDVVAGEENVLEVDLHP